MSRTISKFVLLVAVLSGGAAQAAAIELQSLQGQVLHNAGSGFQAAVDGGAVEPGHLVMTMADGSAVLVFADGCRYSIEPSTVVTVPDSSPCAGALVQSRGIAPASSTAGGASGGALAGVPPIAWVPIGGTLIAFFVQSQRDNDSPDIQPPVSP